MHKYTINKLLELNMEYANDYSGYGNEVLYRMCAEKPNHDCIDVITSKLWIIGRAYSASIERKAGKNFKIEDAALLLKDSDLDKRIREISSIERTNLENINQILDVHYLLVTLLKKVTGIEKRSLASKYLHFHLPKSVFIFDSIANKNLRSRLKRMRFKINRKYDCQYTEFCYRAIHYRDTIFENQLGALSTPRRRLDMDLLGYGKKL